MNKLTRINGRRVYVKAAPLAMILASSLCLTVYAGTNTIPASWSFEDIPPGTAIVTNGPGNYGFSGVPFAPTNFAAESVAAPAPGLTLPNTTYPIAGTHSNVMRVFTAIGGNNGVAADFATNQTDGATNVYIDVMLQARQLPFAPRIPEEIQPGTQVAAYFDTNGSLWVASALYTNNFDLVNKAWRKLNNPPVPSNAWVRLTITLDYRTADPSASPYPYWTKEHYFTVALNGVVQASPEAYRSIEFGGEGVQYPDAAGPGQTNMWFLCLDSGFPSAEINNAYFSSVEFQGAGNVDDLVVSSAAATNGPPPSPYAIWIAGFPVSDPSPGADADGDGISNYNEFLADTNPNDGNFFFHVTSQVYSGTATSNKIVWIGSTNNGTFTIYRSTNLTLSAGWVSVTAGLPRAASGTNVWWDMAPPAPRAFYRPALPTNTP